MGKMKTGIIICSRLASKRLPNKALTKINNRTILDHLIYRLKQTGIPIFIAVPINDRTKYKALEFYDDIILDHGSEDDPLNRMNKIADKYRLDHVIRITHDKIFVDPNEILEALSEYHKNAIEYLYSSHLTSGTGFEIFPSRLLYYAHRKYKRVEHISYAIRTLTNHSYNYEPKKKHEIKPRLLIDYPEDIGVMQSILSYLGNNCNNDEVMDYLSAREWLLETNKMPKITFYTCIYKIESVAWFRKCIESVMTQSIFRECEYIIVDDCSPVSGIVDICSLLDSTYNNIKWIRNDVNKGLSSSSNIALKNAKGDYIIRLDADDFFTNNLVIEKMYSAIKKRNLEALYPNNYFGTYKKTQRGDETHHIGGTLFERRAINHVKFTDNLRNLEGYDFYKRAECQLKIGYYNTPTFFYRQHEQSMSKTNLEEREKVKQSIDSKQEFR